VPGTALGTQSFVSDIISVAKSSFALFLAKASRATISVGANACGDSRKLCEKMCK